MAVLKEKSLLLVFVFCLMALTSAFDGTALAADKNVKIDGYFHAGNPAKYAGLGQAKVEQQPLVSKTARETVAGNQFNDNSSTLTHPYWHMKAGDQWEFSGLGTITGNKLIISGDGEEMVMGVKCLRIKQTITGLQPVFEWWAQDISGNIHTFGAQNEFFNFRAQSPADFPNIKFPAALTVGSNWKYYLTNRTPDGVKKVLETNAQAGGFRKLLELEWRDGDGSDPAWVAKEYYLPEAGLVMTASANGGWLRQNLGAISYHSSYLPYLLHTGTAGWRSFVNLMNTSAAPTQVGLICRDQQGREIGRKNIDLGPNSKAIVMITPENFGGTFPSDGIVSLAINSSLPRLVATGVMFSGVRLTADDLITYPAIFPTDATLCVPNLIDTASFGTTLALRNINPSPASITINLRDSAGTLISSNETQIPPFGTLIGPASKLVPGFQGTGWVAVRSNSGVLVGAALYQNNATSRMTQVVLPLSGGSPKDCFIPYTRAVSGDTQGYIVIVNNDFDPATVTLNFFNSTGANFASKQLSLGGKNRTVLQYDAQSISGWPTDGRASILISNPTSNIVYHNFELSLMTDTKDDVYASYPLPGESEHLIAPDVKINDKYKTYIAVRNVGFSPAALKLILHADGSEPKEFFLPELPANGSELYDLAAHLNTTVNNGWLEVLSDGNWLVGEIRIQNITRNSWTRMALISAKANFAPVIEPGETFTASAGAEFTVQIRANDEENDPINFKLAKAPEGMNIAPDTGIIRWTPNIGQAGEHVFTVQAQDNFGNIGEESFEVVVSVPGNNSPFVAETPDTSVQSGADLSLKIAASDADGDKLSYALLSYPLGMTINPETGDILWKAYPLEFNPFEVIVMVKDGKGGMAEDSFFLTVIRTNNPPQIKLAGTLRIRPDVDFVTAIEAFDPEGDAFFFTLVKGPLGLELGPDGNLFWHPTIEQTGVHQLIVRVEDTVGAFNEYTTTIEATNFNNPPVIDPIPAQYARLFEEFTFVLPAKDLDNDALTFTVLKGPALLVVDSLGAISWTPYLGEVGEWQVTIEVMDGFGAIATADFLIKVLPANTEPYVNQIPAQTAFTNKAFTIYLGGIDLDGDPITWKLIAAPEGMTLESNVAPPPGYVPPVFPTDGTFPTPYYPPTYPTPTDGTYPTPYYPPTYPTPTDGTYPTPYYPPTYPTPIDGTYPTPYYPPTYPTPIDGTYPTPYYPPTYPTPTDGTYPTPYYPPTYPTPIDGTYPTPYYPPTYPTPTDGTYPTPYYPPTYPTPTDGTYPTPYYPPTYPTTAYPPLMASSPLYPQTTNSAYLLQKKLNQQRLYSYYKQSYQIKYNRLLNGETTIPDGTMPTIPTNIKPQFALLKWVPTAIGDYVVTVEASDNQGHNVPMTFNITVQEGTNQPPQISPIPPMTIKAGDQWQFQANAFDPDGDPIRFASINAPAGFFIDPLTGFMKWPTTTTDAGIFTVSIIVTDGVEKISTTLTLTVIGTKITPTPIGSITPTPVGSITPTPTLPPPPPAGGGSSNYPPTYSGIIEQYVTTDSNYSKTFEMSFMFSDPDGDPINIALLYAPSGTRMDYIKEYSVGTTNYKMGHLFYQPKSTDSLPFTFMFTLSATDINGGQSQVTLKLHTSVSSNWTNYTATNTGSNPLMYKYIVGMAQKNNTSPLWILSSDDITDSVSTTPKWSLCTYYAGVWTQIANNYYTEIPSTAISSTSLSPSGNKLAIDADGNLWMGIGSTLYKKPVTGDWQIFNNYNSLLSDPMGNPVRITDLSFINNELWIATFGGGVFTYDGVSIASFGETTLTYFNPIDSMYYPLPIYSVSGNSSKMWFGTKYGLYYYDITNLQWSNDITVSDGLAAYSVTAVLQGTTGSYVWTGYGFNADTGTRYYDAGSWFTLPFQVADDGQDKSIFSIVESNSLLWFGSDHGISMLDPNTKNWQSSFNYAQDAYGIGMAYLGYSYLDGASTIPWFASDFGLHQYTGGGFTRHAPTTDNGLLSGGITDLFFDGTNNRVWLSAEDGIGSATIDAAGNVTTWTTVTKPDDGKTYETICHDTYCDLLWSLSYDDKIGKAKLDKFTIPGGVLTQETQFSMPNNEIQGKIKWAPFPSDTVWFARAGGMTQYIGVNLIDFFPPQFAPCAEVTGMAVCAANNDMWVATKWGIGILNSVSGNWTTLTINQPTSPGPMINTNNKFNNVIFATLTGPPNQVWVGSDDGIFTFETNRNFIVQKNPASKILALYQATTGEIFAATPFDIYRYDNTGSFIGSKSYFLLGVPPNDVITSLSDDGSSLLIGTHTAGVVKYALDFSAPTGSITQTDNLPSNWVNDIKVFGGNIWIATANGYAIDPIGIAPLTPYPNVPFKNVTQIEILNSGAGDVAYFTTDAYTVDTDGNAITRVAKIQENSPSASLAAYSFINMPYKNKSDDPIWATKFALFNAKIWAGGSFGVVEDLLGTPTGRSFEVSTFDIKGSNELWIGTKGGGFLKLLDPNGTPSWTKYVSANQSVVTSIQFIDGSFFWMGTDKGLFKCPIGSPDAPVSTYLFNTIDPAFTNININNIFVGPTNEVWFSTEANNVYLFDGTTFTRKDPINSGLLPGYINALTLSSSGSVLWIGTENGLSKYKP